MRKLRDLREAAGLTQKEAASRLGVHQSAVALWENGRTAPRMRRLREIAEVYRCSVADLLDPASEDDGAAGPIPTEAAGVPAAGPDV